ncbi:hypothetical protein [Hoylesella saccharolytica]|uniref:hypothetical protein n=1 Tax=Hoylesella saccharolytica TaxID=633701 RepID=UPI0028D39428|nr:hypothetical protein [Hoylesella saccharolytica]
MGENEVNDKEFGWVYEGTTTFNGIFIRMLLKGLKRCPDKKETMYYLDKYLGKSKYLVSNDDGTFSIIGNRDTNQIEDDRENILNIIETTDDDALKLNPTKIKWLKEWQHNGRVKHNMTKLPVGLDTDEAIKRFAKAEQVGIIEKTQTGYKRKGISKAQLAYFLQKIYQPNPNNSVQFPDAALSDLFGENRLGKAASQLLNNKETSGKPRGYGIIDNLFID